MKQFRFSLGVRLTLVFLLLSLFPFLVVVLFINKDLKDYFNLKEAYHHGEMARMMADQLDKTQNLEEAQKIVSVLSYSKGKIFVLDENKTYLIHSDINRVGQSARTDFSEPFLQEILSGQAGYRSDAIWLTGYAPLLNNQRVVVVASSSTEMSSDIGSVQAAANWRLAVCLLLVGVAGTWIIWLWVGVPLHQLNDAAIEIGRGNLNVQITNPAEMKDELAGLAETFNHTSRRLQELVNGFQMRMDELSLTQQALSESENRTQSIFNAINDAIFVHDVENGRILEVNLKTIEMYGYSREEFKAISVADISAGTPPYTQEEALARIRKTSDGVSQLFEWLAKDKNGRLFWVEVNMRSAFITTHPYVLLSVRDISERKEMQAALRQKTKELDLYFNNSLDMLCIIDAEGRFRHLNPRWEKELGYASNELEGQLFIDYVHPDDRAAIKIVPEGMNQGNLSNFEIRCCAKDGSYHWIEWRSRAEDELIFASARDITERKKIEQGLKLYTHRLEVLKQITQNILSAASLQAIADGVVQGIYEIIPCERIYFATLDEKTKEAQLLKITNSNGHAALPRFDQPYFAHLHDIDLIKNGIVYVPDIQSMVTKGPFYQPLLDAGTRCSARAFIMVEGTCAGVIGLSSREPNYFTEEHLDVLDELKDISALALQQANYRKRERLYTEELEERVRQRTRQLEAANKELDTFSYSISHDLKSPLRGIEGFSRILIEDYGNTLDEDGKMYLQRIANNIKRMGQLIDGLLAYAHIERRFFTNEPVNLRRLVEVAVEERHEELLSRQVDLKVDIAPVLVMADRDGLLQVIRNLLDNALKFTRPVSSPKITITGISRKKTYLFQIQDNGIGFEMQYHDRIFDIFTSLHRQEEYEGTGVGLALVQKAIKRMGGRVWAESEAGKGATFYLEILC
jgi:PAS domain S-box-containing protein